MTAQELCELLDGTETTCKSCPAFIAPWEKCEWSPFGADMKDYAQTSAKWLKCAKQSCHYLLRVFVRNDEQLVEVDKCYLALSDAKRVACDLSRRTDFAPLIECIVLDGWGDIKVVESLCYAYDGEIKEA